jgi:predicted Zn-dependent protease
MQHPFINDLSDKSLEDLQTSITDLMKKLNFAYSMQNGPMIHQISMVMESYKAEHSKKMDEIMKKQNIQTTVSVEKEGKK